MRPTAFLLPALLLLAFTSVAPLSAHSDSFRVAYDAPDIPPDWQSTRRADPSLPISLHFLMRQRNVDQLARRLEEVSDPASALYGRHMSNAEVQALVSPMPRAAPTLTAFLSSFSATAVSCSSNSDMIEFNMTIGAAERALGCKFHVYRRSSDGATALRTEGYTLPSGIAEHVHAVAPTVMLHSSGRPTSTQASAAHTQAAAQRTPDGNTPKSLRALYKVNSNQGDPHKAPGNKQAVTGFLGQRYSTGDYSAFQSRFLIPNDLSTNQLTIRGDGAGTAFLGGKEAMLDAEYLTAMGANIVTEFWGFSGTDDPPQQLWLKWLSLASNTSDADIPRVFSTSYGEDESYIAADFAQRIDIEFMKLGARGVSILFSSGDSGATGTDQKTTGCPHQKFVPKWPAASPFVTSVGGTDQNTVGSTSGEFAATLSSGGFSNRFARPSWQEDAVNTYLSSVNLTAELKAHINNTQGRAFPDIAGQASALIVADRISQMVIGTSCSCPIVAGLISLINDRRIAAGKSTLGFLNPFVYANPAALNDITDGAGMGCTSEPFGKPSGFPSIKGWDAVTGLGTPNYAAMVQAALALP